MASSSTQELPLSSDQIKQFELNRLKAKQRQRETEEAATASSGVNANRKRPIAGTSGSPTAPNNKNKGRNGSDRYLKAFYEYDLSKMVNSKGGFLVDDGKEIDAEQQRKEKERERQRAKQNLEPAFSLDPDKNPKCRECNTTSIEHSYNKVFKCVVCKRCADNIPEKYSLLTKSECKEDYLLTDPELRDEEELPHLLKANPHSSTYANMMLFMRWQVEEFAWKKWGSPEALDVEFEKRVAEKKKKKNKKFEQSLKDLRRRTKEGVWQKRKDAEHVHKFSIKEKLENGTTQEICEECGFAVEFEEM
ncbi:DNA repair protein [Cylindrobasidium torrendii FP15055 ss-10]|uniref:DNA repair protein RAD14 n=1 Tax=Cylindrobasidium torrendii FP15055 ss-10 TaxID=1314674 RepID=A0A0D7BGT5_9AGAR|nr:DNA repair protein [Cylindrobasidium torrendii FP15055 ss-10]